MATRRITAIVLVTCAAFALQPPQTFEVATVKPNKSGSRGMGNHFDPERATWANYTLNTLIGAAYHLQSGQLVGGPVWLGSDTWDIEAKTERPTTTPQKLEMLQPLLADRFQLRVHWETRELPEYNIVISKGGSKLREYQKIDGEPRPIGTHIGHGLIDAHGIEFGEFVGFLRSELGRPVVNSTGLTAHYDFKLQWVPDESQPNSGGEVPSPDAIGPSIFAAIQEQLGLKLEAMKGPVKVLVVDSAVKPSAN
jgi:uncharacterized protein (TIGR03435 family)